MNILKGQIFSSDGIHTWSVTRLSDYIVNKTCPQDNQDSLGRLLRGEEWEEGNHNSAMGLVLKVRDCYPGIWQSQSPLGAAIRERVYHL